MNNVQYLSDNKGKIKSVLVPLKIWRELVSDSETKYILKSKKMEARLDESRNRKFYINKDEVYEKLGI